MRTGALSIYVDLLDWAYSEKNRRKAFKLYNISKKYEKIWNGRLLK